jgi:uncharacterized protein with FMN-binding domain
MRRALIAAAATAAGLVALLGYRSSSPGGPVKVSTGSPSAAPAAAVPSTAPPTSTASNSGSPTPRSAAPTTTSPSGTYTGQDVQYRYGEIEVRIAVSDGRITGIDFPVESAPDSRSQNINSQALPILTQEALSAQGVNIDVVSGATYTSDAFAQSLQSALAEERG